MNLQRWVIKWKTLPEAQRTQAIALQCTREKETNCMRSSSLLLYHSFIWSCIGHIQTIKYTTPKVKFAIPIIKYTISNTKYTTHNTKYIVPYTKLRFIIQSHNVDYYITSIGINCIIIIITRDKICNKWFRSNLVCLPNQLSSFPMSLLYNSISCETCSVTIRVMVEKIVKRQHRECSQI